MHTLSVLVDNHPGVLTRVSGLFARRGYNIESLTVCETENPAISRMTIVVDGDDWVIEQVTKQLHKLVAVHKINDISEESAVERELALIKVRVKAENRVEILQTTDIFRARVVDMGRSSLTIEATGDKVKVDALVKALRPYGIVELARTGIVAIVRAEAINK
jgi:acetolactate synthase I/III small subunit